MYVPSLRYWLRAGRSLIRNLRRREFAQRWLAAGLIADEALHAPEVWLMDAFPAAHDVPVDLGLVRYRPGNVTPWELFCLAAIATARQPRVIFEFGTFDGATTLALARAAAAAKVITVDLPSEAVAPGMQAPVAIETDNRRDGGVGARFARDPAAERIKQILGDSRSVDYAPYLSSVDMIFIDASHEEAFVDADSHNALAMCAPGGVIVWHDYDLGWPGVRAVIDRLYDAGMGIVRLQGTSLAVLITDDEPR